MRKVTRVGIIGCGVISRAYLRAAALLPGIAITHCADLLPEAAEALAAEFGIAAVSMEALLADRSIAIVLNLTIPAAHHKVGMAALAAGKHVYSEKPLCATVAEAAELLTAAEARGLRVGGAPDTFLGAGQQTARAAIDENLIGAVQSGTACFMGPGHEAWHPAPDFYYAPGGGPLLDMGPYYLASLVNLLGPVAQVTGNARTARAERRIGSGPREGQTVSVATPTHIHAVLEFESGALVTLTTSFDVPAHRHSHIELYGEYAALIVPDPNRFPGEVLVSTGEGDWTPVERALAWGDANWRGLGLADMAAAIRERRPHRADGVFAFHILEVLESVQRSAADGVPRSIESRCDRPQPMLGEL